MDFGKPTSSPMYQVLVAGHGLKITANCPNHLNLTVQAGWEPIPTMGLSNTIAKAGIGLASTYGFGAASPGALVKGLSSQVWTGKEYLTLNIPMHFMAYDSTADQVVNPKKALLKMATPKESGALVIPPGPSPTQAFQGQGFITVEIGQYLLFKELIIRSVGAETYLRFDKDGRPTETVIDVQFSTYFMVTQQYIDSMFK